MDLSIFLKSRIERTLRIVFPAKAQSLWYLNHSWGDKRSIETYPKDVSEFNEFDSDSPIQAAINYSAMPPSYIGEINIFEDYFELL